MTPTTVRHLQQLGRSGNASIDALFERAQAQAWSVERDLAWETEVAADDPCMPAACAPFGQTATFRALAPEVQALLTRRALGRLLQTLFVGESVAQDVSCRLALVCDQEDYRLHLTAQAFDEARHHQALKRFITTRFAAAGSERTPVDPIMEHTYNAVLATTDPAMLVASMQLFLESMAGDVFHDLAEQATHPLLARLAALFRQDETRHIAFGVLYIERHLGEADLAARLAFARRWLPTMLAELERGVGPDEVQHTAVALKAAGIADPWGLSYRMGAEQRALEQARRRHPAPDARLPQLLRSARRAGLLAPEIVEALDLRDHPLVVAATTGRADT